MSSYSLAALMKAGLPMMRGRRAAVLTLTYLGAVRALPNYNVMGLRVNGISGGPIRTLAGVGGPNPAAACFPAAETA